jgi:hypothetical protein
MVAAAEASGHRFHQSVHGVSRIHFPVFCYCFFPQAYDNIIRNRWKRSSSLDHKKFSITDTVRKIDWDVFTRVCNECASAAAGPYSSSTATSSTTTSPAAMATGSGSDTRVQNVVQCWHCLEYGHTKPSCPLMQAQAGAPTLKPKKWENPKPQPAAVTTPPQNMPAIANGGRGDGKVGKGGKGKGKNKDKLANNIAAAFIKR